MQNLYVSPAVQCEICEEMTHYAGYDRYRYKDKYQSYIEIQFIPRCAIHDYSESYTIAIQHRCIRRFIQATMRDGLAASGQLQFMSQGTVALASGVFKPGPAVSRIIQVLAALWIHQDVA